ncbi:MAG: malto-oligosyltrehalose synthase [Candidatus Omnitrophica bacterium CG23_combo_of_CG06-09_8_20_14_all_40_11]|nr:MAG: malto-oligosyltrehalose synthase [Candidatus Omnitrophica bacterium CG23_combo_of_CG06-09_8_20_14_all_40_11]
MQIPTATYRIQFNPNFGFEEAKKIIPYLVEIGVSHLYASPIFKARKGSLHGYDVVDPQLLNPELGETKQFEELIELLRQQGLYWLQDIVPNHMAFDGENVLLMDVLENGTDSKYSNFFDIDWSHTDESLKGRVLAPFLGRFYAECLENQEILLKFDETGLSINYYSLRFPLRIASYIQILEYNLSTLEQKLGFDNSDFTKYLGALHFIKTLPALGKSTSDYDQIGHARKMLWSIYASNKDIKEFIDANISFFNGRKNEPESFNALDKLVQEQFFRLSFWKVAAEEINYRRFFTINELISLRMDNETVFNFTHDLVFRLIQEGKFAGLRIDHIDGLYDPVFYLKRLNDKAADTYIVVEKILDANETLPSQWPIQGTTGYDFMNYVNGIFCKKESEKEFSKIYYKFTNLHISYEELVCDKKRLIIGKHLAGNIDNLAQLMKRLSGKDRYGRDITLYGLKRALVEVMANFPVYRTYVNKESFNESDRRYIETAIEKARVKTPGLLYELNFIKKFLLLQYSDSLSCEEKEQWIHFVMSFQQYTAPLMAKGFEDTILYIYNKLISLNEVGSNPNRFGFSREEFYDFNERRLNTPHTLNVTSTHDTKRGEDVRARINVLSEIPWEWESNLKKWQKVNKKRKKNINGNYMPDENDEYFIYQTLLGAFPFDEQDILCFMERMKTYIVKAVREAKRHTAWIKPDIEYEEACVSFTENILKPSEENLFLKEFIPFQKKISYYGIFNSLSQVVLKITCPGVPDFYQGTEFWDLNLVDPDNRRPIDFQKRREILEDIKTKEQQDILKLIDELLLNKEGARVKLFLIYRLLKARKEKYALFQNGGYAPLETNGVYKDNIIAFMRVFQNSRVIVIVPRFFCSLIKEGELPLGESVWQDTFVSIPKDNTVEYCDAITNLKLNCSEKLSVGEALKYFPGSILISQ